MKTFKTYYSIALASFFTLLLTCAIAFTANAQKRFERRTQRDIARFKGNDSAWIVDRAFARTRFYLGNKSVTFMEFENALKGQSPENAALITKARRKYRTATSLEIGGALLLTVAQIASGSTNNYYSNTGTDRSLTTTITIAVAGLVMQGVGIGYGLKSRDLYLDAVGNFNRAARTNSSTTSIHFGVQQHGLGLALRF
jgi:hypothetical protein